MENTEGKVTVGSSGQGLCALLVGDHSIREHPTAESGPTTWSARTNAEPEDQDTLSINTCILHTQIPMCTASQHLQFLHYTAWLQVLDALLIL